MLLGSRAADPEGVTGSPDQDSPDKSQIGIRLSYGQASESNWNHRRAIDVQCRSLRPSVKYYIDDIKQNKTKNKTLSESLPLTEFQDSRMQYGTCTVSVLQYPTRTQRFTKIFENIRDHT